MSEPKVSPEVVYEKLMARSIVNELELISSQPLS